MHVPRQAVATFSDPAQPRDEILIADRLTGIDRYGDAPFRAIERFLRAQLVLEDGAIGLGRVAARAVTRRDAPAKLGHRGRAVENRETRRVDRGDLAELEPLAGGAGTSRR